MNTPYEVYVKGKNAEEILAAYNTADSNLASYLQIAAQIRSNQELIGALTSASGDSTRIGNKLIWLTVALVSTGVLQAVVSWVAK